MGGGGGSGGGGGEAVVFAHVKCDPDNSILIKGSNYIHYSSARRGCEEIKR